MILVVVVVVEVVVVVVVLVVVVVRHGSSSRRRDCNSGSVDHLLNISKATDTFLHHRDRDTRQ